VQMAVMRAKALSRTPAKDLAKHVVAALPLRIGASPAVHRALEMYFTAGRNHGSAP
jgi:hypothetical protein